MMARWSIDKIVASVTVVIVVCFCSSGQLLGFTITMVKTIVFVSILFSFFANEVYRTNM